MSTSSVVEDLLFPSDPSVLDVQTHAPGPEGQMPVTAETSVLKHVSWGKHVALITDARFSGVSTGTCIGHVGPEALAGGPIGKLREGDVIEIIVDRNRLERSLNLLGENGDAPDVWRVARGDALLAERTPRPDLAPRPDLPADTRLWAALQTASGGTWGGCVYDIDRIIDILQGGLEPSSFSPLSRPAR